MTRCTAGHHELESDAILAHLLDRRLGFAGGHHTLNQDTNLLPGSFGSPAAIPTAVER